MSFTAIDMLRELIRQSDKLLLPALEDLRDAPLERAIPQRGNHAHWIVGHLVFSEGRIIHELALGQTNPAEELQEQFCGGSLPETNGEGYPSYEQLLQRYRNVRAETLRILNSFDENELLEKPPDLPGKYESYFPHRAACFIVCGTHPMHHYGQLADIRCRLGRPRLIA